MAESYLVVKWMHVISATVLFGTGLGTAFHFWFACRGGDAATIAAGSVKMKSAAIIQPVTGLVLALAAGYPLGSRWIAAAFVLYGIAGACWIPVAFIQLRLRDIAERHARAATQVGDEFRSLYRRWFVAGLAGVRRDAGDPVADGEPPLVKGASVESSPWD